MEWQDRSAFVQVKVQAGKSEAVFNRLNEWKHIIGTFMIHWPWDLLAWFDSKNIRETHRWVAELRDWPEVEWTSTQHVFEGHKQDYWFWERPAAAWVRIRSRKMAETHSYLKSLDWVSTFASLPGDWDGMALVSGNTWEKVLERTGRLKNKAFEIEAYIPYQWYWNKSWEGRWFVKANRAACLV